MGSVPHVHCLAPAGNEATSFLLACKEPLHFFSLSKAPSIFNSVTQLLSQALAAACHTRALLLFEAPSQGEA